MDFTIFYAWQSDRIQKTHRYLIRDAVKEAVKQIGKDAEIEDSPRLDRDTQNVSGTPEIAGTICRKIQDSGIFLADLTFVGSTDLLEGHKKLLPNPNVMLELGYAAAKVGLMIDPAAAIVIRGKNIQVIGEGTVTIGLANGAGKEAKIETLKSGGQLDLIELRREAVSRAGKVKE